jgi:hypothetical protein
MHNFFFGFRLSLLIGSFYVHTFFNVKLNDHTPCFYNVQTKNEE